MADKDGGGLLKGAPRAPPKSSALLPVPVFSRHEVKGMLHTCFPHLVPQQKQVWELYDKCGGGIVRVVGGPDTFVSPFDAGYYVLSRTQASLSLFENAPPPAHAAVAWVRKDVWFNVHVLGARVREGKSA